MNFAALDLNLLRVFDAMMLDFNTTRAGERIGLSQPAVSAALGRLRQVTGDDLFVREGNRMVPTPRARLLAEPVRQALHQLEEALASVSAFDASSSDRVFRIGGSDYFSTLLMPRLASRLATEAPRVTVQMIDSPSVEAIRLLSEGAIDLGIDAEFELPDWVNSCRMHASFIATVARKNNAPLAAARVRPGERISPELYCSLSHVLMSMDGSRSGTIDRLLAEHGLRRHVATTVPHFHSVAMAVAATDYLGSLPIHFARQVAERLNLTLYLPPFDPPMLRTILFWHRRHDADAASRWFRRHIMDAMDFGPLPDPIRP
ncbi:LysR substrate-binding domain-containing protein [Aestuariivirga sp.]|uniref:LysR substrate-binding domain-containing protein n=1 Tax=Aestuariivirga sp. TaxID=2650926 RepID=UPI00391BF2F5